MASGQPSESHHMASSKGHRKKKKNEDVTKKIPKLFNYLFSNNGLEEKNIAVQPDGSVYMDDILDVYSDYLEEDVCSSLEGSDRFLITQSPQSGKILVRSFREEGASGGMSPDGSSDTKDNVSTTAGRGATNIQHPQDTQHKRSMTTDAARPSHHHRPAKQSGLDIKLSKTLSYILRHGAEKHGFKLQDGGFLYVEELLPLPQLKRFTEDDVQRIVLTNDKQRFYMEAHPQDGRLRIRANQGHSVQVSGLELTPIQSANDYPTVLHGTYLKCWESIKKQGLSKMGRTHIHFAPGEPGESEVISGMRKSCDILIFIDLRKALADGLEFYKSANNVILSPGNTAGFIPPKYFQEVLQRKPRMRLSLD